MGGAPHAVMSRLAKSMRLKNGVLKSGVHKGKKYVSINLKTAGIKTAPDQKIGIWSLPKKVFVKNDAREFKLIPALGGGGRGGRGGRVRKFVFPTPKPAGGNKASCACQAVTFGHWKGRFGTCKKYYKYDPSAWCAVGPGCASAIKSVNMGQWSTCGHGSGRKSVVTYGNTGVKVCGRKLLPKLTHCGFRVGDKVRSTSGTSRGMTGFVYCGKSGPHSVGVVFTKGLSGGHSRTGQCRVGTTSGHCNLGKSMMYLSCSTLKKVAVPGMEEETFSFP